MATEKAEVPEDFTKAEAPEVEQDDDFDTEWTDRPEMGEMLRGDLLARKPDRGEHDTTILELRLTDDYRDFSEGELVCIWSTNGIDGALDENDILRGDEIALVVDETFEIDGETRRNYAVYTED